MPILLTGNREMRAEYPMLGLVSEAFPYRIPGPRFGRYGSLVMVAPCNMACPYCDVGGYAKDRDNNLPGWRSMPVSEIEDFVDAEVAQGRVIYLTGGEPLMFAELVAGLGQRIRAQGGYSVVCTNATLGRRLRQVSPYVDEFSISLKGTAGTAETISGVRGNLAFVAPHRNSVSLLDLPNRLEFVIVLFEGITIDDICRIYEPFFGRAFLAFKQYRPKVTTALADHTYHTEMLPLEEDAGQHPMALDDALALFDEINMRYPEHSAYFSLVAGGGRDQTVHAGDREYLFLR